MKINLAVEPYVREALASAIAQEDDRLENAILAVTERGDAVTADALNLGLAICAYQLFALHDGERPDDEQIVYLAETFVATEAWAEIDKNAALKFLTSLADERPIDLPVGDVAEIVFVLAAWLLSSFPPEDRRWNQNLDEALNNLEAAAGKSG
jgi:hypothetical protein